MLRANRQQTRNYADFVVDVVAAFDAAAACFSRHAASCFVRRAFCFLRRGESCGVDIMSAHYQSARFRSTNNH